MPDDDDNVVSLPYGRDGDRNSGYAGSETSRARAREADLSGVTAQRQRRTIIELSRSGGRGLTWKELADITGWHHGTTSGALSNLHKDGRISRLVEKRNKCKVYVTNADVDGRDTEAPGRTSRRGDLTPGMAEFIEGLDPETLTTDQRIARTRLLNLYRMSRVTIVPTPK